MLRSSEWVKQMSGLFPLDSENKILKESERVWFSLDKEDRFEAFLHHPKIGDINSLREKYSSAKIFLKWNSRELTQHQK